MYGEKEKRLPMKEKEIMNEVKSIFLFKTNKEVDKTFLFDSLRVYASKNYAMIKFLLISIVKNSHIL